MRRLALASAILGCAPTGVATPVEEDVIVRAGEPAAERTRVEPWCFQQYPTELGGQLPWTWAFGDRSVDANGCTRGCTVDVHEPTREVGGVRVTLEDGGAIVVDSHAPAATWTATVAPENLVPTRVRWSSWCGDSVVMIANDDRAMRMLAFDSASGALLDRLDRAIDPDGGADPSFDAQLYCWDLHTSIHMRSAQGAGVTRLPTHGHPPIDRPVPRVLLDGTFAQVPEEQFPLSRERLRTTTRIYDRVGRELFALDPEGNALWHRAAISTLPGCFADTWPGLVGCSRCPREYARLRGLGDHIVLEMHGLQPTIDVFDADGTHVIHVAW